MIDILNKSAALWGYTEELSPRTYDHFLDWIKQGKHGPLNYLADHRKDLREDLRKVYPDVQSALVFLFDYAAIKKSLDNFESNFKIASYTMGFDGEDYHLLLGKKLQAIGNEIASDIPNLAFQISLDIHPVLERDLAYRAGIGWFGKNSMLINRDLGSYTMIGSLLLNQKLPLEKKTLETDHCGQCTRCADACPTSAINLSSRSVESSKCISTYTIELFKESDPPNGYPTKSKEIFGCDICQEVCPWNNKPLENSNSLEFSSDSIVHFFNRDKEEILQDLGGMSNNSFKTFFRGTSFERLGKKGLIKNLNKY